MNRILFASPLLALGVAAHAAVPEAVTTELTTAKADATTVAGLVIVIAVALAAFSWIRKAIGK